jgi:UDP-glucose 6-dehydrogenase
MAEVCEATGSDVTMLADAIGHDARIGRRFLNAGLGFGGGCLPKDIRAFMARAGELGVDQALTFLREVDMINMRRRTHVIELGRSLLEGNRHRQAGRGPRGRVQTRQRRRPGLPRHSTWRASSSCKGPT